MTKLYRYQSWPLWMQIAIALLAVCILIVIITGEYARKTEKAYLLNNIDENKTRVIDIIASTALESIITEDIPVLNTIVNQLTISNSDIAELRLENESRIILSSWKTNAIIKDKFVLSHSEPIIYEGETFGYIYIKWNLENKYQNIDEHILQIYLFNAVIMFLFTCMGIFGIYRLVTLPIRDIEARLIEHSKGKQLHRDEMRFSQEFGNLYLAVDQIRDLTISKDELLVEIEHRKAIQEELAIARDKALSATETKSTFLANMSHEIRTPLTAIVGFSETLLDTDQTMSDRVESIQTIIRSGQHLQSLINDILDVSKIEAGKLELEYVDSNLFDIAGEVYAMARMQSAEKDLYSTLDYHFPLPKTVHTDQLRLKQILINLCGNAIKFTDEGGIRIDLQYKKESNKLVFRVIDSGVGMTQEQQEKIFQAFTQADSTINRRFGGTGLGLHLSRSLAEKMGGNLHVESTPNVGSCFILTLDAGPEAAKTLVHEVPSTMAARSTDTPKLHGHILLAEDNLDNQRLIKFILQSLNLTCDIANNGLEAVELALQNSYDIILMDMQMPEMNGLDATKALRGQGYKGTITALTANATAEDKEKCLSNGFNHFLTKPIDRKAFNELIAQQLENFDDIDSDNNHDEPIISTLADDPVVGELIPEYLKRLPEIINEIKQAYDTEDMDNLRMFAHNLKSSSGNYGYIKLYEHAAKLEFETVKKDRTGIEKQLDIIVRMQEKICRDS